MGSRSSFLNCYAFMSLNVVIILTNSTDPDEMPPKAVFYLGFHCLAKYLLIGTQNEKGYKYLIHVY